MSKTVLWLSMREWCFLGNDCRIRLIRTKKTLKSGSWLFFILYVHCFLYFQLEKGIKIAQILFWQSFSMLRVLSSWQLGGETLFIDPYDQAVPPQIEEDVYMMCYRDPVWDPRHLQELTGYLILTIVGSWLIQSNYSEILGDLEDVSWYSPCNHGIRWDYIYFCTWAGITIWRPEHCEVDNDLKGSDLKARYSFGVYADWTFVFHVVPFFCHVTTFNVTLGDRTTIAPQSCARPWWA